MLAIPFTITMWVGFWFGASMGYPGIGFFIGWLGAMAVAEIDWWIEFSESLIIDVIRTKSDHAAVIGFNVVVIMIALAMELVYQSVAS